MSKLCTWVVTLGGGASGFHSPYCEVERTSRWVDAYKVSPCATTAADDVGSNVWSMSKEATRVVEIPEKPGGCEDVGRSPPPGPHPRSW